MEFFSKPSKAETGLHFEDVVKSRDVLLKNLQEEGRISVTDVFSIQDRLAELANAEKIMQATVEILRKGEESSDSKIDWAELAKNWIKKHRSEMGNQEVN